MFYVYEWFNINTNEIFYIGKGCKNRYKEKGKKRNALFKEYIKNNKTSSRIIKYFENEIEAYQFEDTMIKKIKPKCNIAHGGYGGFSIIWTDELRKWKSENNPMKNEKLRKNMSINNPMKNKDIVQKVKDKKCKKPIINNIEYKNVEEASIILNVHKGTIWRWCKRGYDTNGNPCYYKNENKKNFHFKKTNSKKVWIDDKLFNSIKEAAIHVNGCSECLIKAIKNNRKYKGHNCKYDNQQPS